jgi:hypothetical protein
VSYVSPSFSRLSDECGIVVDPRQMDVVQGTHLYGLGYARHAAHQVLSGLGDARNTAYRVYDKVCAPPPSSCVITSVYVLSPNADLRGTVGNVESN